MFRLSLVAAFIVHYTEASSSSSTIIRMPRGNMHFPVQYIATEGDGTFGGFATFTFYGRMFQYEPPTFELLPHGATITQARGILIGEPPLRIDFVREHRVLISPTATEDDLRMILPGGRGSAMSRDVQSVLLTPVSETEDILVLNPNNPGQYAFEGQIFYTNITRDTPWPINAAVRLSNASTSHQSILPLTEEFLPFGISTRERDHMWLPPHLRPDIMTRLDELGIEYSFASDQILLVMYNVDITRLSITLPSIEVLIATDTGSVVQIARIDPIDYIVRTDNPTTLRIQFVSALIGFTIDPRIYKNLVIHFDTQNGRVGFADPLVELV
jgi:hypothetical protein